MRRGFPLAYPGMKIGLFGGSFDPAHEGHAHVAETALKRLQLDRVWWLVTPQNPLKPQSAPLAQRLRSAQAYAHGSKMIVTDLESRLGTRFSYDTVRELKRLYPGVRFVFVMGADNLAHFRKWRNWRALSGAIPFAIVSRPGARAIFPPGTAKRWRYLPARHHKHASTALRRAKTSAVADPGAKW